ncbi:hypothetical protein LZK84_17145 [Pseudomonas aeruginosa]|nr:hypothetical protein [Pseudomonas aeruginosa]
MTLEDVLIEIDGNPLSSSKDYGKKIRTYLNSVLEKEQRINLSITGEEVLSLIYAITDSDLQYKILSREIAEVKAKDSYRNAVLVLAGGVTLIGASVSTMVVLSGAPMSEESANVLKTMVQGTFELIKMLMQ